MYAQAAAILIAEGKANALDFPSFVSETGFKPVQNEFIDGIAYDGSKPNEYLAKFEIGIQGGPQKIAQISRH